MPGKLLIRKENIYYPGFQINKIFYPIFIIKEDYEKSNNKIGLWSRS